MNICEIVTSQCELVWNRIPGKKAPAAVALQWYKPDGDVLPAPISPNQPRWGQSHHPASPASIPLKISKLHIWFPLHQITTNQPPQPPLSQYDTSYGYAGLFYQRGFTLEGCF